LTSLAEDEPAVGALIAAAARPLHAYLLVGPPEGAKRAAALAFAAALVCPRGGCGECEDCRAALAGSHIDVSVIQRAGPFITVAQAHEVSRLAATAPVGGGQRVVILTDVHLADKAVPALLKTVEEPHPAVVFVLLAESVPRELVTLASRCARIDFTPAPAERIAGVLQAEGVDSDAAAQAAWAAAGRIERARVLVSDPSLAARRDMWQGLPAHLDGTGATAARLAAEILAALPTTTEDKRGVDSGREALEAQRREQRRRRTDELRWGLSVLAAAYRERATSADARGRSVAPATVSDALRRATTGLLRNQNEALVLQALFLRLDPAIGTTPSR